MTFGCFGLLDKQKNKPLGGSKPAGGGKIKYPRVEKQEKNPQEVIDASVEDMSSTTLNQGHFIDLEKESPVSKDSGFGEFIKF